MIQLALDSLRYWVEEFHIDGFRFDLAVSLGRDGPTTTSIPAIRSWWPLAPTPLCPEPNWSPNRGTWATAAGRPATSRRAGPTGTTTFATPSAIFWLADHAAAASGGQGGRGQAGQLPGRVHRLFVGSGRTALASLNFVTAHDGFTLADLTSYLRKHNEANGEDNRDGHDHNRSYNHGVEGHTGDSRILDARERTARNLMATLLLSLGVPMICAATRSAQPTGNNNAYCQDNALAWTNWQLDQREHRMFDVTRRLIRIRRSFLAHQPYNYPARRDILPALVQCRRRTDDAG